MQKSNLVLLMIIILILSCGNDPEVFKHPLEYTWTIDTLELTVDDGRWRPTDILYLSDSSIYLFGENSHYNPIYWHYNGSKWQDKLVISMADDIIAAANIGGKIFTAGDTRWYLPEGIDKQGAIGILNGNNWEQIFYAHIDSQRTTCFYDIWGDSEDNIWAGGLLGLLYHYDGREWINYCFSDTVHIVNFSGSDSSGLYAVGYYLPNNKVNGYFLKWTGGSWVIEDQYSIDYSDYLFRPFGHLDIYVSKDYIYTCGDGVFCKSHTENEWQKLWQFSTYKFWNVNGSGPNNIYFVGEGGNVVFWDGVTPYTIDTICYPEITYKKSWTDGKQVIITGFSGNTSYVMWGK